MDPALCSEEVGNATGCSKSLSIGHAEHTESLQGGNGLDMGLLERPTDEENVTVGKLVDLGYGVNGDPTIFPETVLETTSEKAPAPTTQIETGESGVSKASFGHST